MARTVLVTGGSGYFGGELATQAIARGDKVRVLDINPPIEIDRFVEYVAGDVRDRATVDAAGQSHPVEQLYNWYSIDGQPREIGGGFISAVDNGNHADVVLTHQAADLGHRLFGCATAQEVERLLRHEMRSRFPEYISGAPPTSTDPRPASD